MRGSGALRRSMVLALTTLVAVGMTAGAALAAKSVKAGWAGASAISPALQPDSRGGSQLVDLATNANGASVAAWDQYTYTNGGGATIGAAVQSAGGAWGAPVTVSGSAGFSMTPRVAIAPDGTAAVSWIYADPGTNPSPQRAIQVAMKAPSATAWTVSTLATGPSGGVAVIETVPIAFDAAGNLTAAWTLWSGSHDVMQAATLPAGGAWSAPVDLAPGLDGLYPALAVNARGDATVAFSATAAPGTNMPNSGWTVSRSGPTGAWGAPVNVTGTVSSSVGYVSNPQVALDANGLATLIWMGNGIQGSRQTGPSTWTAPTSVILAPNPVSSYVNFDLAMDRNGNVVVAASIFDATINVDRASIWVNRGLTDGTWGTAVRLTDPTVPVDAYAASAAMSPDGSLVFVGWIDHYHGVVQVSKLVNGSWSPASTIAQGRAFSSFQEVMRLEAGSATSARAVWKDWTRSGLRFEAASYRG